MRLWQRWKQTAIHNKALVITSVIVAVGTLFYSAAAIFQVWLMNKSASDSSAQVERLVGAINTSIENSVKSSSNSLRDALAENSKNFNGVLEQNRKTLEAARDQAKDSIAQARRALDASIAASQTEQRAWMTIRAFVLSAEPEVGKPFSITYDMQNNGRTPALDTTSGSTIRMWNEEPEMTVFDPPEKGHSHSLVAAGNGGTATSTDTPDQAHGFLYREKVMNLYFHVIVRYEDVFGKKHWVTACVVHVFGRPLNNFQNCSLGNDIDRE